MRVALLRIRKAWLAALSLGAILAISAAAGLGGPVDQAMLLKAGPAITDSWLHFSQSYAGWRYVEADQINRSTVKNLEVVWDHPMSETGERIEVTPIVHDGLMYLTNSKSEIQCLDVKTGKLVWEFKYTPARGTRLCCGAVNRGVAILGDRVYHCTMDGKLMAFDAKTGLQWWEREVCDYRDGFSMTSGPLVIGDKLIVGVAGGEYGIRGFLDAWDAKTGDMLWRTFMVPGPGEPGNETWAGDSWKYGGAPTWLPGTFDPELNLLYWGIGNPGPDFNGDVRMGDNLYSCSIVAINPDTGKIQWHFQTMPHDVFDYDAVNTPILLDLEHDGKNYKAIVQANRNGFVYALDRTNGKPIYAGRYSNTNWEVIGEDGLPHLKPDFLTSGNPLICPGLYGGANWPNISYSPKTGMIYIPDRRRCNTISKSEGVVFRRGVFYMGGVPTFDRNDPGENLIHGFDLKTGQVKWTQKVGGISFAGTLSTAGGLVFIGSAEGMMRAYNDETGEVLWEYQSKSANYGPPITFTMDGKQYIGFGSGNTGRGAGTGSNYVLMALKN